MGVDVEIRRKIWDFILELNRKQNLSIILTTHYLEEAQKVCDKIGIIKNGQLIKNMNTSELIAQMPTRKLNISLLNPIDQLPEFNLTEIKDTKLLDKKIIQLTVANNLSMTKLFALFSEHKIEVKDYKPENNELEELFFYINQ